jgi:Na+-translocating ferredoxin:NAD+ oxidoreductase RnfD subunit
MAGILARRTPVAWLRAPKPTARLRLTLLYGALFLLSGAALLTITYLLVDAVNTATLPDGERVVFSNLPGSSATAARRLDRTGQYPSKSPFRRRSTCRQRSRNCTPSRCTSC